MPNISVSHIENKALLLDHICQYMANAKPEFSSLASLGPKEKIVVCQQIYNLFLGDDLGKVNDFSDDNFNVMFSKIPNTGKTLESLVKEYSGLEASKKNKALASVKSAPVPEKTPSSALPVSQGREKEFKESKESKEAKEHQERNGKEAFEKMVGAEFRKEPNSYDQLKYELFNIWLSSKPSGILGKEDISQNLEGIYRGGEMINIPTDSPESAQKLFAHLEADLKKMLGIKKMIPNILSLAQYPPKIIEKFFGFKLNYGRDAISGNSDDLVTFKDHKIVPGGKDENGEDINYELKSPVLRIEDVQKLILFAAKRMEKGITVESLKEDVPSIDDLLPTLEEVPTDKETQNLMSIYEGALRLQLSHQEPGLARILADDYEGVIATLKTKVANEALRQQIFEGDNPMIRQMRPGIAVSRGEVCDMLARLSRKKGDEENQIIKLRSDKPLKVRPGFTSIPINFYAPKASYDDSHTIMLLDLSGSMAGSRLENLKLACIDALTLLANKPNQRITILGFASGTHQIVMNQNLDENTIAGITEQIKALRTSGTTNAMPAIKQALNLIQKTKTNQKIILGTDGEFDSYSAEEIVKTMGDKSPVVQQFGIDFNDGSTGLANLRHIASISGEGSQLFYVAKENLKKEVNGLVLAHPSQLIDGITVTVECEGAKPYEINLACCFANANILRYVDIPNDLAQHAMKCNKPLKLSFKGTYEDGTKLAGDLEVPAFSLRGAAENKPTQKEEENYVNAWYEHQLFLKGIKRSNQLQIMTFDELVKLLVEIRSLAASANLPDAIVPRAMEFMVRRWGREIELKVKALRHDEVAKVKLYKEHIEKAKGYKLFDIVYYLEQQLSDLENAQAFALRVNPRMENICKIIYNGTIAINTIGDLKDSNIDACAKVAIMRRVIMENAELAKEEAFSKSIDELKKSISDLWLNAGLIEKSNDIYMADFSDLSLKQQLDVIHKLREDANKDEYATADTQKQLAQLTVCFSLAYAAAEKVKDDALLEDRKHKAEGENFVKFKGDNREQTECARVVRKNAGIGKVKEKSTIFEIMQKSELEKKISELDSAEAHNKILKDLKSELEKKNDKLALSILTNMIAKREAAEKQAIADFKEREEKRKAEPKKPEPKKAEGKEAEGAEGSDNEDQPDFDPAAYFPSALKEMRDLLTLAKVPLPDPVVAAPAVGQGQGGATGSGAAPVATTGAAGGQVTKRRYVRRSAVGSRR